MNPISVTQGNAQKLNIETNPELAAQDCRLVLIEIKTKNVPKRFSDDGSDFTKK